MKIKAAIVRELNKPLAIEEIELAPPKANEVLVKTAYTGFCHSDLSMIRGIFKMPLPLVLGHEAAGVVEDVGPGVASVTKGDHVVATWMVACGHCPECRKGKGHICRTSFIPQCGWASRYDIPTDRLERRQAKSSDKRFRFRRVHGCS
jgi:Zn-dependent alcohol dehydrogenase